MTRVPPSRAVLASKWVALLIGVFTLSIGRAQNPVLLECVKINKAYQAANYLSFTAKYRYAEEGTPTFYEDSATAVYKIHGYKYWGVMDSVEFMQNDSFQIAAYLPEQTLALGLPTYQYDRSLPLSYWDSLFSKTDAFTYSIGIDQGYKKITVNYLDVETSPVKQFEMWYDSVTLMVHHIRFKIDNGASDEELKQNGSLSGNIVISDIEFSNYQTGQFTAAIFNSANYFIKSGSDYVPISPYNGFEVFLISKGL